MRRYVAPLILALCAAAFAAERGPVAAQSVAASPSPIPTPVALPTLAPSATIDPLARYGINVLIDLAKQSISARANSAVGTVSYFKRFDLSVQTGPNQFRNVRLHQGTVINPRGASIVQGQRVEVSGSRSESDGTLDADTITIDS